MGHSRREVVETAVVLTNASSLVCIGHGQAGAVDSGTLVLAVGILLVALGIGAAVVAASLVQ